MKTCCHGVKRQEKFTQGVESSVESHRGQPTKMNPLDLGIRKMTFFGGTFELHGKVM